MGKPLSDQSNPPSNSCISYFAQIPIDSIPLSFDNSIMSIHSPQSDVMARMQEAADKAAKGIRDPEAAKKAAENMDRISEEIRRQQGVLNISVPYLRESRNQ